MNKRNIALYSLATLLLAAEVTILAVAMTPSVDPLYRAYYIDKSTDCFPLPVTGAYALGERISFGTDGAASRTALARCGWRDPEATGSWSDGDLSMLRFAVTTSSDLVLELKMQPYVDHDTPRQRIEVTANGTSLGIIEAADRGGTTSDIAIPAAVVGTSGLLDVTLGYPDAKRLSGPSGTGSRVYAIFLRDLRLAQQSSAAPSAAGPRS